MHMIKNNMCSASGAIDLFLNEKGNVSTLHKANTDIKRGIYACESKIVMRKIDTNTYNLDNQLYNFKEQVSFICKNRDIDVECPDIRVMTDKIVLWVICENLVINAIIHGSGNRKFIVQADNGKLVLKIANDTNQQHSRTTDSVSGQGIIDVQRCVYLMEGQVEHVHKEGQYMVTVQLPVSPVSPVSPTLVQKNNVNKDNVKMKPSRVMIVDDQEFILKVMEMKLNKAGITDVETVMLISSQQELTDFIERCQHMDIIILDYMYPDSNTFGARNGGELCQSLRKAGIRQPIVMHSANTEEQDILHYKSCGANDVIKKGTSELIDEIYNIYSNIYRDDL